VLPDEFVADVAALHPIVRQSATLVPFRLFARPDGIVLEGEVDYFSAPALERLLSLTPVEGQKLVLDLSVLGFIDHHGMLALEDHRRRLRRQGVELTIQGAPRWVRRTCDVLGVATL
jgi:anti-anti-sigma factor